MAEDQRLNPINPRNQDSLNTLVRAIRLSAGQFSLILLQCNYARVRDLIVQELRTCCPVNVWELGLPEDTDTLFTAIKSALGQDQPAAVMVFGLESAKEIPKILNSTNQVREEFPKQFQFPLMLWIDDNILRQLIQVAPDLESWATTIKFEIETKALAGFIKQTTDEIFTQLQNSYGVIFLKDTALNLAGGAHRIELKTACGELREQIVSLTPELEASLEFILASVSDDAPEETRLHYEQSLALWRQTDNLERCGFVLFFLGLWWENYAAQHLLERQKVLKQAEIYFKQSIEAFEQSNRPDLAAKFINFLGDVLHRRKNWLELERVANKALSLHTTHSDRFRLARAYGFLAEVELNKLDWGRAEKYAQTALDLMRQAESRFTVSSPEDEVYLDIQKSFQQGWYLFSLAKAQLSQEHSQDAISALEAAKFVTKPHYDPNLYISILETLQQYYFQQKQYLAAFKNKQTQQKVESQFGLRAFIGATRLQTHQKVTNPVLSTTESQTTVAPEIAASGRQQDINRLIERIGRTDCKLTIIYGQSGVGKSSILQAGLVPALQQHLIESREIVPVLQRVYANWARELGRQLAQAYADTQHPEATYIKLNSASDILDKLQENAEENLFTVLIFDQFEEFFFTHQTVDQRSSFYEFAVECLNIPYVKVILSMREDYIHYLLVCNRLTGLEVIDNNILDKNILYFLDNFSKEDTQLVIQSLTNQAKLAWEPELIDRLVEDLADDYDHIRPIELQVLGAQLQTDHISTLAQYQAKGSETQTPKEVFIDRYLDEVIRDCGPENRRAAELSLYLLTDEGGTRPQKTKAELAETLSSEADKLALVLEIFVDSGLVLMLPSSPADRYQLVHDYLVNLIRQQRGAQILQELSDLRKQKEKSKAQIQRQKENLQKLSIALFSALILIVFVFYSNRQVQKKRDQLQRANKISELELESNNSLNRFDFTQTEGLLLAIRNAQTLKKSFNDPYPTVEPLSALQRILYGIREKIWFDSQQEGVLWVNFSPDGQQFATAGKDNTVKLWDLSGKLVLELTGHTKRVWGVSFSPDNRQLATGSADGTVQLWSWDYLPWNLDNLPKKLRWLAHPEGVASIKFSPNGQLLATAGANGKVIIWDVSATRLGGWDAHPKRGAGIGGVSSLSFSADGELLATAGNDGLARLWTSTGQKVADFFGHEGIVLGIDIRSIDSSDLSLDEPYIATAGEDGIARLWNLSGRQLFELRGHHEGPITSIRFSPDGKQLVTAGADGIVRLWDLNGRKLLELNGHQKWVQGVDFSPKGSYLVTGDIDGFVRVWNLSQRDIAPTQWAGHAGDAWSVNFSPDGQKLATAGADGFARLWNISEQALANGDISEQKTAEFKHDKKDLKEENLKDPEDVFWVSFSPDGQYLATAGKDGFIKLWSQTGQKVLELGGRKNYLGAPIAVNHVSFSPTGNRFATASGDGVVTLWARSGQEIAELVDSRGHEANVYSTSFSPDGKYLATASNDGTVSLWDVVSHEHKSQFEAHLGGALWVSFSPNGAQIATAGRDGKAKIWKLSTEGEKLSVKEEGQLIGHRLRVSWVGFSQDGKYVATAGRDGKVIIWTQPRKNKPWQSVAQFDGHQDGVFSVSFSPDGKYIAVAEGSGQIKLWRLEDLEHPNLLKMGCGWLTEYFIIHSKKYPDVAKVCLHP